MWITVSSWARHCVCYPRDWESPCQGIAPHFLSSARDPGWNVTGQQLPALPAPKLDSCPYKESTRTETRAPIFARLKCEARNFKLASEGLPEIQVAGSHSALHPAALSQGVLERNPLPPPPKFGSDWALASSGTQAPISPILLAQCRKLRAEMSTRAYSAISTHPLFTRAGIMPPSQPRTESATPHCSRTP